MGCCGSTPGGSQDPVVPTKPPLDQTADPPPPVSSVSQVSRRSSNSGNGHGDRRGSNSGNGHGDRSDTEKPVWSRQILSSGADKDIFPGSYMGRKVAVCVAKTNGGGSNRIQNEINVFKKLGKHPHIIEMYTSGTERNMVYFALEVVEPIGYDLDRLKNMYAFARQAVPSRLMARIFTQLVSALNHMHKNGLIHRDLKTENVLIDERHDAKLIDMGIACKIGKRDCLRAGYLAPELCEGTKPLGIKVDSWGLGIILHQVYQNQWKVLTESGPVEMLDGKPSRIRPMEKPVREAMCGLLQISVDDRWNLKELLDCDWLKTPVTTEVSQDWQKPTESKDDNDRRYLRRYVSRQPCPTALAVFITKKNHRHLIGRPIDALGLSSGLGITVLLVSYGQGSFESRPGADTPIRENSWVYFGVPQGEGPLAQAVEGLEGILDHGPRSPGSGVGDNSGRRGSNGDWPRSPGSGVGDNNGRRGSNGDFRALCRQEVVESGKLVEFTVEFDCFPFPGHIGAEAMIGVPKRNASTSSTPSSRGPSAGIVLDLRKNFSVNLAGIHRLGQEDPEWFPRASAVVRPEDLGLVLRLPCLDGSTSPTMNDSDLERLMNKDIFEKVLAC